MTQNLAGRIQTNTLASNNLKAKQQQHIRKIAIYHHKDGAMKNPEVVMTHFFRLKKSISIHHLRSVVVAIFLIAISVFSTNASAACTQDVYSLLPESNTLYVYEGHCATYSEAFATCAALANKHGYPSSDCAHGGGSTSTTEGRLGGGWFWDQNNIKAAPSHLSILTFGGAEPPPKRKSLGTPGCPEQCLGDPINAITGNKFETVQEIKASPSGFLDLSWTYNSQYDPGYAGAHSSIFGEKRTFTYGRSLIWPPTIDQPIAYLSRPDGQAIQFTQVKGVWIPDIGHSEILEELPDSSGWIVTLNNGEKEEYSLLGELKRISKASGRFATLNYSTSGFLENVRDDQGRTLSFHYNNDNLVDHIITSDGGKIVFNYDSKLLRSVTYPDGFQKIYLYNEEGYVSPYTSSGSLTGVVDESGNRLSSTWYDASKKAYKTELANGANTFSISFSTMGGSFHSIASKPAGGWRESLMKFETGNLIESSFSDGCDGCTPKSVIYKYTNGLLANIVRNGTLTQYEYDDENNEKTRLEAPASKFERRNETDWDKSNKTPISLRAYSRSGILLKKSIYTYNSRRQVTSLSEQASGLSDRSIAYEYCDLAGNSCPLLGLPSSKDGPQHGTTDRTSYEYYPADDATCTTAAGYCLYRKGDLKKVIMPSGQATSYLSYDGAGRPLSIKDANGIVTDYTYHPRGWLTATKVRGADASSEADDRITRIDYWPTGLVKQVTQPDGAFTAFTYDAAHRLTDITDNAGNTVHYTLDNAGNRIKEDTSDASGTLKRTLSRVYNQLGQLKTQATAGSDPTDFAYDANGNTTTVTDALATATQSEYDPLNRLSRTLQDVAGIKADTKFEYDALDNLTKVTDPKGLDTTYDYNGFGDLVKLTSPDTGITSYTYDSAGNRATQTDARGNTTAYSYDALNRLTKVTYPTTSLNVTYTYDATQTACTSGETFSIGRLTKMQDGGAITQYCYNRFGDLVRKVQTSNGITLVLRYDYTIGGQLQRMTYPDGAVVDYVRNAQGQTTQVGVTPAGGSRQVLLTNATYYPFGPAAGWTYGNGRTLARRYDLDYRPQAIQDTRPGGLDVGFGFDPAGNLTALTPAGNTTPEIGLGYDTLGRLTALKDGSTGTLIDGYSYDATGNRLSAKVGTATQIYTYPTDSHRLRAVASVARTYDKTGNTLTIGGKAREFSYDASGRMSMAKRAGALVMNYRYNGKGEQVRRFLGTTNTYTLYDEAGHWLGDYDSNGAPKQQAIWLDDLPVGLLANANKLHYIEPDHLGSPRVVIDPTRDVAVWTWSLKGEAFGNTAPNQDPDGDGAALVLDMRFPGQRFDAASGLNQNYLRDYEAATGRYGQSDPIGLGGGISTFSYVAATPLTSIDPFGLAPNQGCVASVVATCTVVGGSVGYWGGGILGGAGGTAVTPVAGTAGGFIAGSTLGGLGGASAGGLIGGLASSAVCPDEDDKDECEKLLRVDTDVCNAITRRRGATRGEACHASATQRYAACLRNDPIPPLNTWNN
ncbi:RHS repeat-associated core domain-containing protein [Xanthomonas oryzae]|uniref:RHS repeat-associated core domain-containing protein n=1 Tax=Xanthomonas oryzae TaxID=347 RepID=UPI001F5FB872|nr:RHS repeat-associated core domain-containing protein [Xanthomonas oryzae]